ncbi:unnamed protein product [Gemmataceae bacterium]|nr:unnamed protein product [Gemmataceae bacterium]VTT98918.1 unnamed protein product [Gemmataceae bacterium]
MSDGDAARLASEAVQDFHASLVWGYDPVQHAELERAIADAITRAVAAERSRARNFELMCRRLARVVPDGVLRRQALDLIGRLGDPTAILRDGDQ